MTSAFKLGDVSIDISEVLYFHAPSDESLPMIQIHKKNNTIEIVRCKSFDEQDIYAMLLNNAVEEYNKQNAAKKADEYKSANAKKPVKPKYYKFRHNDYPFTVRLKDIIAVRYQEGKMRIILSEKKDEEFNFMSHKHGKETYDELIALLN